MPDAPAAANAAVQAGISRALGAVAILSAAVFSFDGGQPVDALAQAAPPVWGVQPGAPWGSVEPGEALAQAIRDALYNGAYAHRLDDSRPTPAAPADDPAFPRRLAAANDSRERWEPGWVIQFLASNGQVFVRKGERERVAMPGAFISTIAPGMAPQPGSVVQLRVPREAPDAQPGYYFAFGETLDELAEQLDLARFYFHCAADGAAALIGTLTRALNRFQVPFQMKAPSAPALYGRTDAAVLYVGARFVPITMWLIEAMRDAVPLAPSVPLFARPLWPGIAGAVDPGNGESFGIHRCRLMAEGIVAAWREGRQDEAARREAVAARFAAVGLDLARPWLGPCGVDRFDVPARAEPA